MIVYVILGLGVTALGLLAAFAVAVVRAFDTDKDLSDFSDQAEARAFTRHTCLHRFPRGAVESLLYQRWTDWIFEARVRLPSSEAATRYLEEAKLQRKLDDGYCSPDEPTNGARYILTDVSACGSVERISAQTIEVHCNTRRPFARDRLRRAGAGVSRSRVARDFEERSRCQSGLRRVDRCLRRGARRR